MMPIAATESWSILQNEPFSPVSNKIESLYSPTGQKPTTEAGSQPCDYVNAVVFNKAQEALILEKKALTVGWSSWRIVEHFLRQDEDPITAVQQALLHRTGYSTENWLYLGSYVMNANQPEGAGHFFVARQVEKVAEPKSKQMDTLRWIPLKELRYGLLDGRIAALSYAINVSLALLTL